MGAEIKAIEYIFPEQVVSNQDLANEFPQYDFTKFEKKVGISRRYVVPKDETALTLAIKAVKKLFTENGIAKNDIDFILYCTQSPEYFLPTSACIIQSQCDIPTHAGALDFNLGCSGYTYGLSIAKGLINGKSVKNVLLVTSETYSRYINKLDRSNRAIFGDAATATLISFSEENRIGEFLFGSDGTGSSDLIVKNGAAHCQYNPNAKLKSYGSENQYTDNDLYMNGPSIFNFTNNIIPEFTKRVVNVNQSFSEKIDFNIFHQANAFLLNNIRRKIGIPKDEFYISLEDGGNTVSNTIPIALKRHLDSFDNISNYTILLIGFGVGLSWCGGLIKMNNYKK
ncbi:ketoacyl-ACP synthase III [Schleiferiaceae bacterium]|nr:ketoacyl-ACP synthase III [Schleiferiaceae bacterium]